MLMDGKNKYCENIPTAKAIYTFHAILSKNSMSFFTEREENPKICMKQQNTPNSQSNLQKAEQSWRYLTS